MQIIDIIQLDKKKKRIIFEQADSISLYNKEIYKLDWQIGKEISDEEYREVVETILTKRAKIRVLNLLKDADRTKKQIQDKLKQGYYPEKVIEEAILYAEGFQYIDDERYARNYIEAHSKEMSKRQLIQKLREKGIQQETIDEIIQSTQIEEEIALEKLIQKKHISSCSIEERKRLYAYLMRKGFDYDIILKKLNELGNTDT